MAPPAGGAKVGLQGAARSRAARRDAEDLRADRSYGAGRLRNPSRPINATKFYLGFLWLTRAPTLALIPSLQCDEGGRLNPHQNDPHPIRA